MIKKTIVVLWIIALAALASGVASINHARANPVAETTGSGAFITEAKIHLVSVGGCEYVVAIQDKGIAIVHHAGCSNPIHRRDLLERGPR